ncbi:MAG: Maf family protein, partial [Terriglobales bacterium]
MALVLASSSPRRQDLLRNAGIAFAVEAADLPEAQLAGEAAQDFARRMAREKAQAIFARRPSDAVLGADTIVVVDGAVLGKPIDTEDAARMLRLLSG